MANANLKMFATSLATYARKQLNSTARGSLLIRMTADDTVIGGVYGNSNYLADARARREVDMVKQRLREGGLDVLQFGLSLDGYSWALLVKVEDGECKTKTGRAFQREVRKAFLDEVIEDVHRALYGDPIE
jgi:hypothetical protein